MAFEPRTAGDPATVKLPRKRAAARALDAALAAQDAASAPQSAAPAAPSPFGGTRPKRVRNSAAEGEPARADAAPDGVPEVDLANGGFAARTPRTRRSSTATSAQNQTPLPTGPLTSAPSVEVPATLLRDDRIAASSAASRRRSAQAGPPPSAESPVVPVTTAASPAADEVAVPGNPVPQPMAAQVAVPSQVARSAHPAPAHPAPANPAPAHPAPAHPASHPVSPTLVAAGDTLAPDPHLDASHEAVVVSLGGGRYGIPMDAVDEVGRPPAVTRVPGLPAWLAGVANWRGRVLAVVDLRPLLAAPQNPLPRTGRLVVCSLAGVTIGLITEEVEGVVTVVRESTEQPLVTLAGQASTLVGGQVAHARGPIALLNLDAVFALRTQLPRARRAG